MRSKSMLCRTIALAVLAASSALWGSVIVTLDTSPLPSGSTFYLDFQLQGSDGNTVQITQLNLGSGTHLSPDSTSGGASGSFTGGFTLTDVTQFQSEVRAPFHPGTQVSYELTNTNQSSGGFVSDTFTFAVEDSAGANTIVCPNINTCGTSGASLTMLLDGNPITFDTSGLSNGTLTAADSRYKNVIPVISAVGVGVPEPAPGGLLGMVLLFICYGARKRGKMRR
jgi:hypothetical protein